MKSIILLHNILYIIIIFGNFLKFLNLFRRLFLLINLDLFIKSCLQLKILLQYDMVHFFLLLNVRFVLASFFISVLLRTLFEQIHIELANADRSAGKLPNRSGYGTLKNEIERKDQYDQNKQDHDRQK